MDETDRTDKRWTELFKVLKEKLKRHECRYRSPGDAPAVEITAEERILSTSLWKLEDGSFEPSDFEPEGRATEVNFLKVECAACQARLIGGWNFRNIMDGRVINVDAPFLEDAWKMLESEYSDPIHATEEWAAMDV
jgi:hypothetical protein